MTDYNAQFRDPQIGKEIVENVLLLPDGCTTTDQEGWKAIWAYVARDEIIRGHLKGITVDEFEESEDEELIDNIIHKVYRKNTHLFHH